MSGPEVLRASDIPAVSKSVFLCVCVGGCMCDFVFSPPIQDLITIACEGVQRDTHTLPGCVLLAEACLFESESESPSVKNYLTVLHFQCCGFSVSTPCAEQSLSVRGVWLEICSAAGKWNRIKLIKVTFGLTDWSTVQKKLSRLDARIKGTEKSGAKHTSNDDTRQIS